MSKTRNELRRERRNELCAWALFGAVQVITFFFGVAAGLALVQCAW